MPRFDVEEWRRTALAVAGFRHAHGHWPKASAGDSVDATERSLGRWLIRTRATFRTKTTGAVATSENRAFLDANCPGWTGETDTRDDDREAKWKATLAATAAFRSKHNKMPSPTAHKSEERRLGVWLGNQRSAHRRGYPLSASRRDALNDQLPGWEQTAGQVGRPRVNEAWAATLAEIATFTAQHHRWPSRRAEDPDELKLARWLNNTRSAYRNQHSRLTPDRVSMLDAQIPGWIDLDDLDETA